MSDRDCENCKHHTEKGCDSWNCEFEQRMTKEDIHREKEQAYMQGYEDACKKYRKEPCDTVSRGVFEQVMWERDVAIKQLKELGYGLGEKPKTGRWIFVDKSHEHAHCSECDYGNVDLLDGRPHNYCPNCGAKMAESEDEK